MTPSDRPRFVELMLAMAGTFSRDADEALLLGYSMAVEDVPIDRIESAVKRAMKQCKFMPTGAELRELAGDVRDTDRAVLAWNALEGAASKHGYYTTVTFDDPLINAAVNNLGGWEKICSIESSEEWMWFRKDFERVYVSLCRTGASPEMCRPLVGFHDRSNGFLGYCEHVKEPLLIATGLPAHRPGLVHKNSKPANRIDRQLPRVEFKSLPKDETP